MDQIPIKDPDDLNPYVWDKVFGLEQRLKKMYKLKPIDIVYELLVMKKYHPDLEAAIWKYPIGLKLAKKAYHLIKNQKVSQHTQRIVLWRFRVSKSFKRNQST